MITFACPGCGQSIETEPANAGFEAECPACSAPIVVPENKPPPVVVRIAQTPPVADRAPLRIDSSSAPPLTAVPPVNQPAKASGSWSNLKSVGLAAALIVALGVMSKFSGSSMGTVTQASGGTPQTAGSSMVACNRCGGTGKSVVSCHQCFGRRTITTSSGFEMVCPKCQGSGAVTLPCGACNGSGRVAESRENLYAAPNRQYNANDPMGEYN